MNTSAADQPAQYNQRNTSVRRLMKEAHELREPTELYFAQPLEDNLFEWHFTVRGPPDTDFAGGIYHGRILLPSDYPMKPPSIILMTPNGRFELHKKICLSISGYHPESWQPSWSIRTALLAIIGFMPTHAAGAVGSLDYPAEERRKLAKKSCQWRCDQCGVVMDTVLPELTSASATQADEARQLAAQIAFKDESESKSVDTTIQSSEFDDISTTMIDDNVEPPPSDDNRSADDPITTTTNLIDRDEGAGGGGTSSLVLIVLVSLMLAALLFRRLCMMNEWSYTVDRDGAGSGGSSSDL